MTVVLATRQTFSFFQVSKHDATDDGLIVFEVESIVGWSMVQRDPTATDAETRRREHECMHGACTGVLHFLRVPDGFS